MKQTWLVQNIKEADLTRLAELIALKIRTSDILLFYGDLGAGKTTFARALIRAVLHEPDAEVPSPTYALVHTYHSTRLNLSHVDLYRLRNEAEIEELSLPELLKTSAVLLEWPERTQKVLGQDILSISIHETSNPEIRDISFVAQGTWNDRLLRLKEISDFLLKISSIKNAKISYLQGDASTRAYARLSIRNELYILMDWPPQPDGPPLHQGLSYSRIAHLAESTISFESVAGLLQTAGLRVPKIFFADHTLGLLLLEDLGQGVYSSEVSKGTEINVLWKKATDVLVEIRKINKDRVALWNKGTGKSAPIKDYDSGTYKIEIQLLLNWYWPFVKGKTISTEERKHFEDLWETIIKRLLSGTSHCLTLRDYHSPNLIWIPGNGEDFRNKVGIIDFQDALIGHPAFDLVSLLQDARLDIPSHLENELYTYYISEVEKKDPSFDAKEFSFNYSALGAQRNTKILGIFARLFVRDHKPNYLKHIPRIWRYLNKNLQHPDLSDLKNWYSEHFSNSERSQHFDPPHQVHL